MTAYRRLAITGAVVLFSGLALCQSAPAAGYGRQYYSSWTYYPSRTYYVRTYYYKPVTTYTTYRYHYCVYYPSRPRYVYYYNPRSRRYWGRLDLEGKDGAQYSLLAEKDQKEKLDDIEESAFPKPGKMPAIPESEDGATIEPIDEKPTDDQKKGDGKDLPE